MEGSSLGVTLNQVLKGKGINQAKQGKVLSGQSPELLHLKKEFEPGSD